MSMQPQVTQPTGASTFTILERYVDQWGRNVAKVKGMYDTSRMEVKGSHEGCEFNGEKLLSHDAWADNVYCSGCNYSVYYPIGN